MGHACGKKCPLRANNTTVLTIEIDLDVVLLICLTIVIATDSKFLRSLLVLVEFTTNNLFVVHVYHFLT